MDRMADTVIKRNNNAELELERRVMQYAMDREQKIVEEENKKKESIKKRDEEIKKVLQRQLEEKLQRKEIEAENNKQYVKMIIERDELDKKEQREKEKRNHAKMMELQKYQLQQISQSPRDIRGHLTNSSVENESLYTNPNITSSGKKSKKRINLVGGPMHHEDILLNKGLLKEISIMKRNQQSKSPAKKNLS